MGNYLQSCAELLNKNNSSFLHRIKVALQFYSRWKLFLNKERNSLLDEIPWITFEANDFVDSILTKEAIVFEYGSGGSTLFYAKKARRIISVEHDLKWFNQVRTAVEVQGINNCECILVEPELYDPSAKLDDAFPSLYGSDSENYRGYNFQKYVAVIDSFPNQFFDLIAVDGRARVYCIHHAISKVKQGGYLLLDNSERPAYQRVNNILAGWEKQEFFGPGPYNSYFWQTTIWRRSEESRH